MALAESIEEDDEAVEVEGIQFIYNSGVSFYMEDLTISYEKSWAGEGFQVYRDGYSSC